VQPSRRQQAQLQTLLVGGPQIGNHPRVIGGQAEHLVGKPRVRRVPNQNYRQREAERDAQEFERRQAEGAPLIDGPQREYEMRRRGAVQQQRARHAVPDLDRDLHASFGGVEGDQAERVIGEVCPNIGEKDEAGRHAQVAADRARDEVGEPHPLPNPARLPRVRQSHPRRLDQNLRSPDSAAANKTRRQSRRPSLSSTRATRRSTPLPDLDRSGKLLLPLRLLVERPAPLGAAPTPGAAPAL